jgi:anti-anti-sigma factor
MEITISARDGMQLLTVTGRLDASTAPSLQARFDELLSPTNKNFILDLSGVDYVSSGGLRVLLVMTKKVKTVGGGIVLAQLHPFVEDLLRMSGFHTLIPAAVTIDDAVKILAAGGTP